MNEQRSSPRPSTISRAPTEGGTPPVLGPWARALALALALSAGCAEEPGVCDRVEGEFCTQCSDGAYTCTYEDVSVTTEACGGCQTRLALMDELCGLEPELRRAEVDAAMVCESALAGDD